MTQPSGWYDDPQDPSQLRYWDGVVWTSHVSPRVSPTVEQSTIGMPYGVIPASARPQSPGSQGAQGAPTAQRGYDTPQQDQGQPGGQLSEYGQGPGRSDSNSWAGSRTGRPLPTAPCCRVGGCAWERGCWMGLSPSCSRCPSRAGSTTDTLTGR